MKVSELARKLEELYNELGDVEVVTEVDGDLYGVMDVFEEADEEGEVVILIN